MDREQLKFDEYKILINERHELMKQYAQALTMYLLLMGYVFKDYIAGSHGKPSLLFLGFLSVINSLGFFGAWHFKKMAMKAEKRSHEIAKQLGLFEPQSVLWGFYFGISAFIANELVGLFLFFK